MKTSVGALQSLQGGKVLELTKGSEFSTVSTQTTHCYWRDQITTSNTDLNSYVSSPLCFPCRSCVKLNILIGIFSLRIPSMSTTSPNSKRKCFSPLCDASCLYPTPLIHFFILYSTWLHLTSINNATKLDVLKILLKPFLFSSSSLINHHSSL